MSVVINIEMFLKKRPKVKGVYGYGSGVFKQVGYTDKDKPQLDLILVVDNLKEWHKKNMELNQSDYSFIAKKYFSKASIESLKGNTGVTYISNIEEDGNVFKYGTIEEKDLERNLLTWDHFYMPGRFQKQNLVVKHSKKIDKANQYNCEQALFVALITLSRDRCTLLDLYTQICGLSYFGDTRMKFAENPNKVLNIVKASYDGFKEIYGVKNKYFKANSKGDIVINDDLLLGDLNKLPTCLFDYINSDTEIKNITIISDRILEYLSIRNKEESMAQTKKGLLTNGISKSVKYASAKVLKKFKK